MKGICFLSTIPVREEPSDRSQMVSQLLFGETFTVLEEFEKWLRIKIDFDSYEGYIDRKQFREFDTEAEEDFSEDNTLIVVDNFKTRIDDFGVLNLSPGSEVPKEWLDGDFRFVSEKNAKNRQASDIIKDAKKFLGTPYLWGGRSCFGIDCSGFIQIIHKINGIKLPRDAWQQAEISSVVKVNERKTGDLAFFKNKDNKIIHVGLLLSKDEIIHASAWVKENRFTNEGILDENEKLSHSLHSVVRL